jgi:AcrR family transcriptional regulator
VPRPTIHGEDTLIDAARGVVLEHGLRAATVSAIARASGAPTGSIYHRFRSIDELLARAWIRAARRGQDALLEAMAPPGGDPVGGALAVYDFCLREPEDALLLGRFGPWEFDRPGLGDDVRAQLEAVNEPIAPLYRAVARELGGRGALDTVQLILVDLPFGAALRHIQAGRRPPASRRALLERAVRAMIER